jgi:putative ATP-dependent endonuclease of OLD family
MGILIDKLRISGFRGLNDFEINLSKVTVLTGTNNVGKTTILKALQLALGSRSFLTIDDLYVDATFQAPKIIIDIRIIPVDDDNNRIDEFDEDWEVELNTDNIRLDGAKSYIGIRSTFEYNRLKSEFERNQLILNAWESDEGRHWQDITTSRPKLDLRSIPFYYIEAQRDVVDDIKQRNSYLGKLLADVSKSYSSEDLNALEGLIEELNEQAVEKSNILSTIRTIMKGVDTAMDRQDSKLELTPFSKKLRDLNKNMSIHYGEAANSFTMDYHGMGTRSWSSLLTFKAFVSQNATLSAAESKSFFPIIAIEEPESHLHPNAQKKLYSQMVDIPGQKVISTHSPYIASCTGFNEIRGLYKDAGVIQCGEFDINSLTSDEKRKLKQKVINTRGEIFFSKAIILFEGETEEQALPILAEKYFGRPANELGIDFIGVGGAGAYYPFLLFAETFNIPWYIFSDGEVDPVTKMTDAVRKQKRATFTTIQNEQNVFIIDNADDFEKYIVRLNYLNDIIAYVKSVELPICVNEQHERRKEAVIDRTYTKQYVLDKAKTNKTEWALIFAFSIQQSQQPLPPLVVQLFDKLKTDLHYD